MGKHEMGRTKRENCGRLQRGWSFLLLAMFLSGCSLAVPEAGADGEGDRLIGAFITEEYLDLYDIDSDLRDHGELLVNGGEVTLERDSQYEGRLWAQIDKSRGSSPTDWEISFAGVRGEYVIYPQWKEENAEPYRSSQCTEGISDIHTNANLADDREEYSIEGTLYILPGKREEEAAYHANPVYQTAKGDIYVVSGQGFIARESSAEGELFSTTLDGEISVTENGRVRSEKNTVTVRYAVARKPVQIRLYQMDKSHRVLKQDACDPEKMPETVMAESDAAYLLVETEQEGLSGAGAVFREIVEPKADGETFLETFYVLDDRIVAKRETQVRWDQ